MMKRAWIILVILAVASSVPSLFYRISYESSDKTVDIISSGEKNLSDGYGVRIAEEYTVEEWVRKSMAGIWAPPSACPFEIEERDSLILIFDRPRLYNRALEVFMIKLSGSRIVTKWHDGHYYIMLAGICWDDIKGMGMGILEKDTGNNRIAYAMLLNDRWVNREYIDWCFSGLEADALIFKGDEVPGYPENTDAVSVWIRKKKMKVCLTEFNHQKGFKEIVRGNRVVRFHRVPEKLTSETVVRRVMRAVRERGIRAVYIGEYACSEKISKQLVSAGFIAGVPAGCDISKEPELPLFFTLIAGLSGLALMTGRRRLIIASAAVMLISLLISGTALNVLAIICAVSFPLAATWIVIEQKYSVPKNIVIYLLMSITAGILLSSSYSIPSYMVKLEEIRGVKAALLLPIILSIPLVFRGWSGFSAKKVTLGGLMLFFLAVCIAMVYILRSSNLQAGLVSILEIKFRLFLEDMFVIRPRFKEFLIGHPFLITGLYLYIKDRVPKGIAQFFIIIGLVGQVSVINSFMHIHTPFALTLLRTLWGLVLGIPLGLMMILIVRLWLKRTE
ncbi:MAG: DUF5693 family protein [Elusimicrobiota bacterium]